MKLRRRLQLHLAEFSRLTPQRRALKKLAGAAAGTAAWAINVGNEFGQVLISVLTASEGSGLRSLASGVSRRYELAKVPPPVLLYIDRDCCGERKVNSLLSLRTACYPA